MLRPIPQGGTLWQARERRDILNEDIDIVLRDLVDGNIVRVSSLRGRIVWVKNRHPEVSYQELRSMLVPRLRVLIALPPDEDEDRDYSAERVSRLEQTAPKVYAHMNLGNLIHV